MEWVENNNGIVVNTMPGDDVGIDVNDIKDDIFPCKISDKSHIREHGIKSGKDVGKPFYTLNLKYPYTNIVDIPELFSTKESRKEIYNNTIAKILGVDEI